MTLQNKDNKKIIKLGERYLKYFVFYYLFSLIKLFIFYVPFLIYLIIHVLSTTITKISEYFLDLLYPNIENHFNFIKEPKKRYNLIRDKTQELKKNIKFF